MESQSHSEQTSRRTRDFFVPGWLEGLMYFLGGIILIVVLNAGAIIGALTNNDIESPRLLKAGFSNLYSSFSHSFSSALGGRLGQILLWAFVGAIVYIGLWTAHSFLNSFENDVIAYHYMHPSYYRKSKYLGSSIFVKIFLVALGLILAGFLFVAVTALLPALAALAGSAVYNFTPQTSPLYVLCALVGTMFVIYITIMLTKLISHLWALL